MFDRSREAVYTLHHPPLTQLGYIHTVRLFHTVMRTEENITMHYTRTLFNSQNYLIQLNSVRISPPPLKLCISIVIV